VIELDNVTLLQAAQGPPQSQPSSITGIAPQKQQFNVAARALLVPMQASGDDPRFVEHQNILWPEVFDQIGKRQMSDTAVLTAQGHQARRITAFGGVLGDEIVGKIEVEFFEMHRNGGRTYRRPGTGSIER
jgi:hypothetical protein